MSTRCQVKVVSEGIWNEEPLMLYHHHDGYPSNMIPLLKKAHSIGVEHSYTPIGEEPKMGYEGGRAGKVASVICASDPLQFEPEQGLELHGDIEYLYVLYAVNRSGGSLDEEPVWEVEVYVPTEGFWDASSQALALSLMRCVLARTPLLEVDGDVLEAQVYAASE